MKRDVIFKDYSFTQIRYNNLYAITTSTCKYKVCVCMCTVSCVLLFATP